MSGICAATFAFLALWVGSATAGGIVPLRGFKHDSWSVEQGAPSRINSIAQSPDGYLWIGSVEGLFRFDGVKFTRIVFPAATERVVVSQVMASRAGVVWVGLARGRGIATVRDGRLVDFAMPNPSREVNDIREGRDGAIWVARGGRSANTLARYFHGRWQEFGAQAGLPDEPVWSLLISKDGTLWVVCDRHIVFRRPGSARFEPTGVTVSPRASLAEDPQGRIWLADTSSTRRIVWTGGKSRPQAGAPSFPQPDRVGGTRMLFDRGGGLWETTWNSGVLRIAAPAGGGDASRTGRTGRPGHPGKVAYAETPGAMAAFNAAGGLTSDQTHALFQDREGNVWIGSELGLDALRPARVVVESGIPANSPTSYRMASAKDGTVYVADATTLYAIRPGAAPVPVLRTRTPAQALCTGWSSGVWLVAADRVIHVGTGTVRALAMPGDVRVLGCAQDREGRLWLPALDRGLFLFDAGRWRQWPGSGAGRGLPADAGVNAQGKAVILFRAAPPDVQAAPFDALYDARSQVGPIEGLLPGRAMVFVSGAGGIEAPFAPGTGPLAARDYPWAASLNGLVQTDAGETWGIGDAGIVRLRSSDLERALHQPGRAIAFQRFDFRDGLNSFVQKAPGAQVAQGGDGRIWFLTRRNVMSIDPAGLTVNRLPPTVIVEGIAADGREYSPDAGLSLPAGTRSIAIAYTATSLTVPGRVRFRYRLTGLDDRWIEAGAERQVVFSGLAPGRYAFQVIAANEDGVWNSRGQALTFSVERPFYQQWWFLIVAALAVGAALYVLYQLRVRYVMRLVRDRLEERVIERERIARELHDTLLQSVQGLIMRFQSVADRLSGDHDAQAILGPALDRAEDLLVEGRDRVRGLRSMDERHLESELEHLVEGQVFTIATRVSVTSKGAVRPIAPAIIDDILGIVSEALCNVARHAEASEVEIHVDYGRKYLGIFVRDDGIGIAPDIMAAGKRAGHYGLLGMRERASRLSAKLTIESGGGFGTLIRFRIPARLAYLGARASQ